MAVYSVFVILVIVVELACAGCIFFDKSWKDKIPTDNTGDFDMMYKFFKKEWKIIRWVALAIITLEALLFLLTLVEKASNKPVEYDSDEEFINPRQPLISRPAGQVTGLPVVGGLDQRPSRIDAWSTRMRDKYGLDNRVHLQSVRDTEVPKKRAAAPSCKSLYPPSERPSHWMTNW